MIATASLAPALAGACGVGRGSRSGAADGLAPRPTALKSGAKISFLNDANQAATPLIEQILAGWRAQHPGVAVEWLRPSGTVSLTAMVTAGTPPDVFAVDQTGFGGVASGGETLALDPYARRDRFDVAEFFPASLDLGKWQGKQHGLPRALNCGVFYTNLSAFDQAGLPRPPEQWGGPKWGWADFRDVAQRLTVSADDPQHARFGSDLLGGNSFYFAFVFANGGELYTADMTATRLAEPASVEALQFLADVIHRQRANPTPEVVTKLGGRDIFNNGQAVMQLIGASNLNLYQPIQQFTWDWRPLPAGKAGAKDWAVGSIYAISSRIPNREEAWSLLQHVTGLDATTQLGAQYSPPRRKALQAFLEGEAHAGRPPKNGQMLLDAAQNARLRGHHPRYAEVQKVLDEELGGLWANGGSAQTAADAIKRRVDPILQSK